MGNIISEIKITDNYVIVKTESTLDKKAKKLFVSNDLFFTTAQAKKLGLDANCVGYELVLRK
jgi:hypothetical protein